MTNFEHFDGGRLCPGTVSHGHIVNHPDGRVSAVVVKGVPALVCDLCEAHYFEHNVTDVVVAMLDTAEVRPGAAVAIDYSAVAGRV